MAPTPGGSSDGPALPPPDTQPSHDDPTPSTPALIRCDPCAGRQPSPGEGGRVQLTTCPAHTGALNRAANDAVGITPGEELAEYWHVTGTSPALAALAPADGWHYELAISSHTASAIARILTVAPSH